MQTLNITAMTDGRFSLETFEGSLQLLEHGLGPAQIAERIKAPGSLKTTQFFPEDGYGEIPCPDSIRALLRADGLDVIPGAGPYCPDCNNAGVTSDGPCRTCQG